MRNISCTNIIIFCPLTNEKRIIKLFDSLIGRIIFEITSSNETLEEPVTAIVQIKDKQGKLVGSNTTSSKLSGFIDIPNATLWWPYLMHPNPGYLYTVEVLFFSHYFSCILLLTIDLYNFRSIYKQLLKKLLTFID